MASRFDNIEFKETVTIIKHSEGATTSSYGDEIFTVSSYTTPCFFQLKDLQKFGLQQGDTGHELEYDSVVFFNSTSTVTENETIRYRTTRYRIVQKVVRTEGTNIDHYQVLCKREVT